MRLDLSDNPLTEEVVPALAAALAAQPQLRALNLNDTSLGPDGVGQLCGALLPAATNGGQQVGAEEGAEGAAAARHRARRKRTAVGLADSDVSDNERTAGIPYGLGWVACRDDGTGRTGVGCGPAAVHDLPVPDGSCMPTTASSSPFASLPPTPS